MSFPLVVVTLTTVGVFVGGMAFLHEHHPDLYERVPTAIGIVLMIVIGFMRQRNPALDAALAHDEQKPLRRLFDAAMVVLVLLVVVGYLAGYIQGPE